MDEVKTCQRPGCGKKLTVRNHSGVCGSGCLSPEAPPVKRAKGVQGAKVARRGTSPRVAAGGGPTALERFRVVAEALGKDADALLEEFAETWLAELRGRVE